MFYWYLKVPRRFILRRIQNFNSRNDIMPPIAANNTYIQTFWYTHILSPPYHTNSFFSTRAICFEYLSDGLQLADSNFRATVSHVSYLRRFLQTVSICMGATLAKFPTVLYYLIIQHVHSILRDNLFLKQKPWSLSRLIVCFQLWSRRCGNGSRSQAECIVNLFISDVNKISNLKTIWRFSLNVNKFSSVKNAWNHLLT